MKNKGLPTLFQGFHIFHYSLPSKGSHEAVHFIWKQLKEEKGATCTPDQLKLIRDIHAGKSKYYSRSTIREVKKKLLRLGMASSAHANLLMKESAISTIK